MTDSVQADDQLALSFVVCVSDREALQANLLSSPCLQPGSVHEVIAIENCPSAADGLNLGLERAKHGWVGCSCILTFACRKDGTGRLAGPAPRGRAAVWADRGWGGLRGRRGHLTTVHLDRLQPLNGSAGSSIGAGGCGMGLSCPHAWPHSTSCSWSCDARPASASIPSSGFISMEPTFASRCANAGWRSWRRRCFASRPPAVPACRGEFFASAAVFARKWGALPPGCDALRNHRPSAGAVPHLGYAMDKPLGSIAHTFVNRGPRVVRRQTV